MHGNKQADDRRYSDNDRIVCLHSVNQSVYKSIFLFDPFDEIFFEIPQLSISENAFLKLITVIVDKLTG